VVFFSSRSRHTRSKRDWSSDVCSSDLFRIRSPHCQTRRNGSPILMPSNSQKGKPSQLISSQTPLALQKFCLTTCIGETETNEMRSEERRVGKERRTTRRA